MKYFVLGALASGFLLYGMSMVHGATGHLDLAEVAKVVAAGKAEKMALVFGIVFLVSGLAFAGRRAVPHVGAGRTRVRPRPSR